jgi:hypothetical protein
MYIHQHASRGRNVDVIVLQLSCEADEEEVNQSGVKIVEMRSIGMRAKRAASETNVKNGSLPIDTSTLVIIDGVLESRLVCCAYRFCLFAVSLLSRPPDKPTY